MLLSHFSVLKYALRAGLRILCCWPLLIWASDGVPVKLEQARFHGLTRIELRSNIPLLGIAVSDVLVRRADGSVLTATDILSLQQDGDRLTLALSASAFARVSAGGATVATRAFGAYKAALPLAVDKPGEPVAHGYLIGTSGWTDEGWNTISSDPAFVDSRSGQHGLYRFSDTTPDRDERGSPARQNGVDRRYPLHRDKSMLVLFVEFPDRKAADAEAPYQQFAPYLNYLQPAVDWFRTSSYGQLQLKLVAPQHSRQLDWMMLSKNASAYKWGGNTEDTENMFTYCREIAQLAYDRYGIRVDAYDLLLIVPASGKSGLPNGPANINDQYMGQAQVPDRTVLVERNGKAHTIDTFVTAGNDLFYWGYRWLIHETGHTFGLPDLYMYQPKIQGEEVDRYFYVGGWDMMGNIGGQSTDFLAWHKWKLHWIRDDQVDVVSAASAQPTRHSISPVEMPGGSKMVVVRTGLSTAYVAEFRTALGVNALDQRAKQAGVLLYRLDTQLSENGEKPLLQIISKQYYNSPAVGGARNLTGVWRPLDKSLDGYEQGTTWQAGDVFSDPDNGVTIRIESLGQSGNVAPADVRLYTGEDTATLSVSKSKAAQLTRKILLQNAVLRKLTNLHFTAKLDAAQNESNWFVAQRTQLQSDNLLLKRANGKPISASQIKSLNTDGQAVHVEFKPGTFASVAQARGLQLATAAYFNVGASAAVPVRLER